jgi:DNA polymerase-3 subunit epsilon
LDTETSGISDSDRIVEIAWKEIDEDFNVIDQHESLIDCQCFISPVASAVHGLTQEDLTSYPTIEEFFSEDDPTCYGSPVTDEVVLIGHKCAFDERFIRPFINVKFMLDTLTWARRLYPESETHQLSTLAYALGLPRPSASHRAMSDVDTAYYLLRHIAERTGMGLPQLVEASQTARALPYCPLGKHKGKGWSELPAPYLRWMSDAISDDLDIAFSVNQELQRRKQK